MPTAKRPASCPADWRPPAHNIPLAAWEQVGRGAFEARFGIIGTVAETFLQVIRVAKPLPGEPRDYEAFRNHKFVGRSFSVEGAKLLAEGRPLPRPVTPALRKRLTDAAARVERAKTDLRQASLNRHAEEMGRVRHPCASMTLNQRKVFEQIAVGNEAPRASEKTLAALERRGLIVRGNDKIVSPRVRVATWFVPIPIHMQWCKWASENRAEQD